MQTFGDCLFSLCAALPEVIAFLVAAFLLSKWLKSKKKYPPGPSGLPLIGYLPFLEKEPHKQFLKWSKQYGENIVSFRLGRSLVVILNEYEVARDVLSQAKALNRHPDIFTHVKERGFFSNNGLEWNEQRKFCMLSMKGLGMGTDQWEKMVMEEVKSFILELSNLKGSPVAVTDRICTVASNNVISLLIGRRLDPKTEKDKLKLLVDFMDQSMSVGLGQPVTLIPKLRELLVYLKIGLYYVQHKTVTAFSKFLNQEIMKHQTKSEETHDLNFIDLYLEKMEEMRSKSARHYFTENNLEGNLNVLFLGGSDTVATSLDWILRLMAAYPEVQKKVQKEIDEELGRDGYITYKEKKKLPYTMAVLREGQRYCSIVPLSVNRQAIADIKVKDYIIPKGCHISANLWAIHHDPKYWEEPNEFKPERFLSDDGKTIIKNLPSFGAFSFGKRNCPGEKIAYIELLQVFASLLRRFRILPPDGEEVHFDFNDGLVPHLKPQPLRFLDRLEESCSK